MVEDDQMLMDLPHVPYMRHDWKVLLAGQKTDGQELAHAREPCAVSLYEVHRTTLHEVLEHDAVRNMLPGCDFHRCDQISNLSMSFQIVRMSGFFDPKGFISRKLLTNSLCRWQIPSLVCIKHDRCVISRTFTQHGGTAK